MKLLMKQYFLTGHGDKHFKNLVFVRGSNYTPRRHHNKCVFSSCYRRNLPFLLRPDNAPRQRPFRMALSLPEPPQPIAIDSGLQGHPNARMLYVSRGPDLFRTLYDTLRSGDHRGRRPGFRTPHNRFFQVQSTHVHLCCDSRTSSCSTIFPHIFYSIRCHTLTFLAHGS